MNRFNKLLLVFGAILTFAPLLVGLLITVISMVAAFHDLSQQGISDPNTLAAHIGRILTSTLVGLIFSAVGVIMVIVAGLRIAFNPPTQQSK